MPATKKMLVLIAATAAPLMAAGAGLAPAIAQPARMMAPVAPPPPTMARPYTRMAAGGDQFEIQSSRRALQVSRGPRVRQMAQHLIRDHTRMSREMMMAARAARMAPPPPVLAPHHADMLRMLRMTPRGRFDRLYREQQVMAHQEPLNLHRTYAAGGDNPILRRTAAAAVPVIQMHLDMAQRIAP